MSIPVIRSLAKSAFMAAAVIAAEVVVSFVCSDGRADESDAKLLRQPTEFLPVSTELLWETQDVVGLAITAGNSEESYRLFVARYDGRVLELDGATRQTVGLWNLRVSDVCRFCVSPSGDVMGAVSDGGEATLLHLASQKPVVLPGFANDPIADIALSADGLVVFGFVSGKVRLMQHSADTEVIELQGHRAACRVVAFSPDGATVASAADDGSVTLWDTSARTQTTTWDAHAGRVRAVGFSDDGQLLATGGEDGVVKVWNLTDTTAEPGIVVSSTMVWSLDFSPNASLLAIGDADGTIEVFSLNKLERTSTLEGHTDSVTSIRFTPDSQAILSGSFDGRVSEWHALLPAKRPAATISLNAGKAWTICTSPVENHIAVAGQRGFVAIFDLATGKLLTKAPNDSEAAVDCIQYSPNGEIVATAGWRDAVICTRRANDLSTICTFDAESNVRAITFSPDGSKLVAGTEEKLVLVWDTESGEELHRLNAHSLPVYDVSYSPDGRMLATCSGNWAEVKPGVVKLWAADSMSEITRFRGHETAVRTVVFHPTSTRLASVSEDGIVRIWDVASQAEVATLKNSHGSRDLVWHPNGRFLATGLHDGTTNIWDVDRKRVVARLAGSDDTFCIRYTADASVLCAVGGERQLTLWDTSSWIADTGQDLTIRSVQQWAERQP